jgi:hypothetical protein
MGRLCSERFSHALPYLFFCVLERIYADYLVLKGMTIKKRSDGRKKWEKGLDNSGTIEGIFIFCA